MSAWWSWKRSTSSDDAEPSRAAAVSHTRTKRGFPIKSMWKMATFDGIVRVAVQPLVPLLSQVRPMINGSTGRICCTRSSLIDAGNWFTINAQSSKPAANTETPFSSRIRFFMRFLGRCDNDEFTHGQLCGLFTLIYALDSTHRWPHIVIPTTLQRTYA